MLVTKGATDVLLDRCVVTAEERTKIEQVNEQFSNEGLRVLALRLPQRGQHGHHSGG